MATWADIMREVPDLAKTVQGRFEATGLGVMATIRADGTPRICPIEPAFGAELWLGMMPDSRKVADLGRDARLALHSATCDKAVKEGDAKLTGRAAAVQDDDEFARFVDAFTTSAGSPPPPGPFPLFRVDISEVSFLRTGEDHLVIEWWREGEGYHRINRR